MYWSFASYQVHKIRFRYIKKHSGSCEDGRTIIFLEGGEGRWWKGGVYINMCIIIMLLQKQKKTKVVRKGLFL
jgi:hypothetical protein